MSPLRFVRVLSLLLIASAPACLPHTQFNRGVDVDYRPSAAATGQSRLVGSAVVITTEQAEALTNDGLGAYLGEIEVSAERSNFSWSTGAKDVEGRVSIEAAQRGATHMRLLSSETHKRLERTPNPLGSSRHDQVEQVTELRVRYGLYRVEEQRWASLPASLTPVAYH